MTLDDVKRVAKRLYDPSRLTVVIGGSPAEGRSAPQVPRAPVRPAPTQTPPQGGAEEVADVCRPSSWAAMGEAAVSMEGGEGG